MAEKRYRFSEKVQWPQDEPWEPDRRSYQQLRENLAQDLAVLGIDPNEPGFEKTKSGHPRFFELTEDGTFKNALENAADLSSDAFLDKLSQGRVFAFPMGEKYPIQIAASEGKR